MKTAIGRRTRDAPFSNLNVAIGVPGGRMTIRTRLVLCSAMFLALLLQDGMTQSAPPNITEAGSGGTGPVMPIGINLPNEQAIRQQYGTKSVLLHNVVEANEKSQGWW
jgi:hypothetical protein